MKSDLQRKARGLARRAAVEVLARTDKSDPSAIDGGDIVLLLHHIPDQWIPRMEAVVEMMMEFATPVTYSEICNGKAVRNETSKPRFSVTFDDGNLSQVKAAEHLEAMGVSACYFIIGDALDADEAETDRLCREQLWMDSTPFMVRSDLDRLLEMGHEVGSHTLGHVNLAEQPEDGLRAQIETSKELLSPWLGNSPHFAWPFGGAPHFSRRAYDLVAEAGYVSCATGMRGMGTWKPVDGAPPLVFRQSINLDDSLAVQRRFVLNSEQHLAPSREALSYLN